MSTPPNASTPGHPHGIGWDGLFLDDALERAYLSRNWEDVRHRLKEIGFYGGPTFALMGLVDYTLLGASISFALILAGRLLVGAIGLRVGLDGTRANQPEARLTWVRRRLFMFELLTVPTFLLEMALVSMPLTLGAMGALTMVAALYAYAPTLSRSSLWLGPLLTIPFVALTVSVPLRAQGITEPGIFVAAVVLLGFANMAGWKVAVDQAGRQRLAWLGREALRREIDERRQVQQALEASESNLRSLFDAAPVPMVLLRLSDGCVLQQNPAARQMAGPDREAHPDGQSAHFYADPMRRATLRTQLLAGEPLRQVELQLRRSDGAVCDTLVSAQVLDVDGERCALVGLTDVSSLKSLQRQLREQAEFDALTGLPNRRGFGARSALLLRQPGRLLALLMLDLDHFKRINDAHGHTVGDEVLTQFGALLGNHLRQGDVMARFGGEEFVALLALTSRDAALDAAERMRAYIEAHPFATSAGVLRLSVSIGMAMREAGSTGVDELAGLLRDADKALYLAKQGGRNRVETGGISGL